MSAHPDEAPADHEIRTTRPGPLAGIVVADLSRVLAGPYATMLLADLGATVIKIESPSGDDTRQWSPPVRGDESTYFLSVNRGKYSIALDFTRPADLEVVRSIVARADVVVENFKAGGLQRFGLDYASLVNGRPDLVYASITGFGPQGSRLAGYDLLAQALSGMMDLTGDAHGEPMRAGVAVIDVVTGLHAAVGILAALHRRRESGRGDLVEVNLMSSALSALVNQSGAFVAGGVTPTRMGNAHPSLAPYEPFPTRDTELVIAVGNDPQFARLCRHLGLERLVEDPRFTTNASRRAHREELRELLAQALAAHGADHWFDVLTGDGVPAAPILDLAEGFAFADRLGLSPVAMTGTGARRIPTVRSPIRLAADEVDYAMAPPELDADHARVLRWLEATAASGPARDPGGDPNEP